MAVTPPQTMAKRTRMARYSWEATEKTRLLIKLLTDTLTSKKNVDRRYVTGNDWDRIFLDFNTKQAAQPVANVFTLKNRLALLKIHYKDFQKVIDARKDAPDGRLDANAWMQLMQKHPETQKWRGADFEFYDELKEYFKWAGVEEADSKDSASSAVKGETPSSSAPKHAATTPAAVTPPNPAHMLPARVSNGGASVDALAAAVTALERQNLGEMRKRPAGTDHPPRSAPYLHQHEQARQPEPARLHTPPPPVALPTAQPAVIRADGDYVLAQHKLGQLRLGVDDRVDAKLFLLNERNLKAFLHMEEDEQRAFLQRYCFNLRDRHGRWNASA